MFNVEADPATLSLTLQTGCHTLSTPAGCLTGEASFERMCLDTDDCRLLREPEAQVVQAVRDLRSRTIPVDYGLLTSNKRRLGHL